MTAQEGTKHPLRPMTAGALLDMNFPPREFALDPWLLAGQSALVWAATGVGKTWLTLSFALAMAGGGSVWEYHAPRARKVLLVDGEMNVQDLRDRTRTLLDTGAVAGVDMEALRRNLILMPRQHQNPKAAFWDITDGTSQDAVLDFMGRIGAEVIIVDNLTTCADGLADENDATAFRAVMGFLLKMKQDGKTAVLVHHANKAGTDARGSTALDTTFEVKLGLKRPPEGRTDVASFVADFGKLRTRVVDSVSRPRVWTLGDRGWTVRDDEDGAVGRVMDALRTLNYVNQTELAEALGMAQSTVSRALKKYAVTSQSAKDSIRRMFIEARELRNGGGDDDPFGDLGGDDDDAPF